MKYFFYITLLFFYNQNVSDKEKIKAFSDNLIDIIAEENICDLLNIKIYPEENTITLRTIDYILGNDHNKGFVDLFRGKDIITEIYGPYENDNETYYYLIYHNPKKIIYDSNGNIDAKTRRENWGVNYIETLVTVIDSEVYFYRTPFFFETDSAW